MCKYVYIYRLHHTKTLEWDFLVCSITIPFFTNGETRLREIK